MPFLTLLLTTILFLFIAFLPNQFHETASLIFFRYASLETRFMLEHIVTFLFGYILLTGIFIQSLHLPKGYPFFKKSILSILQLIGLSMVGFFIAFVLLFFIAFVQLNILAVMINANPQTAGMQTDRDVIAAMLKTNNTPPAILIGDLSQNKELLAVAFAITGRDTFYGNTTLSSFPASFVVPIKKPVSGIVLVDNTLILSQINAEDLQTISPVIGYLYVKHYFPNKLIKSYPKIRIMSRQEYLNSRGADAYQRLVKIDEAVKKLEDTISSISAIVNTDKTKVADNQTIIQKALAQRDAQYSTCLGNSHYSLVYCKDQLNQWNNTIAPGQKDINDLTQQIQDGQNKLQVYQDYDAFFTSIKNALQLQKENIPHELGLFAPEDSIQIVLDTNSPHAVADYFETVTHEYLHYASFVASDRQFTDSFFEEGLTEYFARQAIKDTLNADTNLGYPVFVKIISEMTNIIPESELADIYFTKDEGRLESTLDRVYGDGFYQNNQLLFETLQYASDPKQILKVANEIMKHINGTPLTEKDLYTTYSSL